MCPGDRGPAPLDDPAWFGAVMGTAATGTVAALHPGRVDALNGFADVAAVLLIGGSALAFIFLLVRDFAFRGLGRGLGRRARTPETGPALATIPGAINVLAIAVIRIGPAAAQDPIGGAVLSGCVTVGSALGVALTVSLFVGAFEHERFPIEKLSGVWFVPETVVLLGAYAFAELAWSAPEELRKVLAVLSVALFGIGSVLFGFTAVIFVNRLVVRGGVHRNGAAAMWIMLSPLAVTSLTLQAVAGGDQMLGGVWTPAVAEGATFAAAALWGFALWWIAVACVVTVHIGRAAFTRTAADWGFVFPVAALVIATVTLARVWSSMLVEVVGLILGLLLAIVWAVVAWGAVATWRELRHHT